MTALEIGTWSCNIFAGRVTAASVASAYGRFGSPPRRRQIGSGVMCSLWKTGEVLSGINFPQGCLPVSSVSVTAPMICCFCVVGVDRVACGYKNGSSGTADSNVGTNGNYWSATENSSTNAWGWNFRSGYLGEYSLNKTHGFSVRLFRDF